jgi:hypothetical protein
LSLALSAVCIRQTGVAAQQSHEAAAMKKFLLGLVIEMIIGVTIHAFMIKSNKEEKIEGVYFAHP